ncbi:kinase-like protein [Thozetella sp. PMI_491]|nr:kinase-like protein [Thozetella sp. PMI_491]
MNKHHCDLVLDSRLDTELGVDHTVHNTIEYDRSSSRKPVTITESWKKVRELGRGGYGKVWLEVCWAGRQEGGFRAIKEISKDAAPSSIHYDRELEAIAKFSHRKYVHCFVKSFGWFENPEAVFIAMEFFELGDLQRHMVNPFSENEVCIISSQLSEGLAFMHGNHFAHRDLKPANIFVVEKGPSWWVKIGDFGISRRSAEESRGFHTQIGTPGYLAPEVIHLFPGHRDNHPGSERELHSYSYSVDMWALGVIAYQLLVGQAPFPTFVDLAKYVGSDSHFSTSSLSAQGLSQSCCGFVSQNLAASPLDRLTAQAALKHPWLDAVTSPKLVDLIPKLRLV